MNGEEPRLVDVKRKTTEPRRLAPLRRHGSSKVHQHQAFNILAEDVYALEVLASLRDNHVGETLGRFDELLVHCLLYTSDAADE